MPERIIINGEPVDVPPEVVTDGRAAVQAWYDQQVSATPAPSPQSATPSTVHEE